jgi:hypothetical protein
LIQEDGDVEITELENLERAHSPAFRPSSPDYNPERPPSPVYVPGASSPAYNPERPPSPVYVPGPSSTLKEYGNDPWKTEKAVTDSDSESEDEEKPPIIIHHGEHDNSDLKMLSSVDDLEKDVEDMAENDKKITFNP